MNQLTTNQISDPSIGEPFTGPMLSYLQSAYNEVIAAIAQSLTVNNTPIANQPYALYGCIASNIGGSNFSFTTGYIFYNNIIYNFPAIPNINLPGGTTASICTITTKSPPDIIINFTDGVPRAVSQTNTLILSSSAPITNGATAFNFNDIIYMLPPVATWNNATLAANTANTGSIYAPASYIIDRSGRVTLRGRVTYNGPTSGSYITLFTLPVGYRPVYGQNFIVEFALSTGAITSLANSHLFSIQIDTSGLVKLIDFVHIAPGFSIDLSLDQISFLTI